MPRAVWNGTVIAESDVTELVEGNHYFPPGALKTECFQKSSTETVCGWKGTANYYTIEVDGQQNVDAAWYYADPKPEAENIRGHVAFWKGVSVEETPNQTTHESGQTGVCDVGGGNPES